MQRCLSSTSNRFLTRASTRRLYSNDEGSIRGAGGSWARKEQAQEDMWVHKRDLEHLKELQEKLKHAQDALAKHTEKITQKAADKAKGK